MRNSPADRARTVGGETQGEAKFSAPGRRRRHIGLWLVAGTVAAAIAFIVYTYAPLNPTVGRLSPREHPLYFPVLMVHIVASSVALVTCVGQVWPWLRNRHPRVHRYTGRVYVLAGVYPAAIASMVLLIVWPEFSVNESSDFLTTPLWLAVTTVGFVFARRHRYEDHRRWMLRSFALTYSFITSILFTIPVQLVFKAVYSAEFSGNAHTLEVVGSGVTVWIGWVVPLLAVEWWLDRELIQRSRRAESERPNSTAGAPFAGQPSQAARSSS